jgi:hypothetical protein
VGSPLQFAIAVCAAIVASTFVPSIRRSMPRWFEVTTWVALILVCWVGMATIREPHARELTASVNWAAGQMLHTLLGLAGASVVDATLAHRFTIATAVATLFGADLLALALVSSYRKGGAWQPQVRLRDWMEVPAPATPMPSPAPAQPTGIDVLNERLAAATTVAGAAAATWSVQFLIWARDVGLPRTEERLALAVAVGRVETRVWLESVRETVRELEDGARSRSAASGPEVNKLALRVAAILNGVTDAEQRIAPSTGRRAQVVDIQALRIAQSLGRLESAVSIEEDENANENGPGHSDRLAS